MWVQRSGVAQGKRIGDTKAKEAFSHRDLARGQGNQNLDGQDGALRRNGSGAQEAEAKPHADQWSKMGEGHRWGCGRGKAATEDKEESSRARAQP